MRSQAARIKALGNRSLQPGRFEGATHLGGRLVVSGVAVLSLLVACAEVAGQTRANSPRIGYVFPAGGQQGTSFQITIGGQYLEGVEEVVASHPGIKMTISGFSRPLTQREVNELMQKLQAVREKVQELLRSQGGRARMGYQGLFAKVAQEMGITMDQVRALEEFRRVRMDPKRQPNPQIAERVLVDVSVESDVPPGQYHLRVKRGGQFSNPLVFQVDSWPEVNEAEPNDREAMTVDTLPLPAIINGQILPGDVDRFRLPLKKGQKVVFALAGRSLIPYLADAVPGWFQAVLALHDPRGKEVAFADDWRFHPDPVLLYEVPEDGLYTIVVSDAIYRGREDFVYRLLVGEVPFVTSVFPLGGQVGKKVTLELTGWNLPANSLEVDLLAASPGIRILEVFHAGASWNHLPLAVDQLPDIYEQEPNQPLSAAHLVGGDVIINGRIDSSDDVDVFRVDARAGEEWVVEVMARRLGSPLDSVIRVTDSAGKILASCDDYEDKTAGLVTHHADSYVRVKAPKDGPLFVHLADMQQHGGREYAYRLRISRPQPDFALRLTPSTVNVSQGVHIPITVWAVRKDGMEGDIMLELRDAPAGFRLSGNWVPAGKDQVVLTLSVGAAVTPGVYKLKMVGRASFQGKTIEREVVPADDMMQAFIYRHLVPADCWLVAVGKGGRFAPGWGFAADSPVKIPLGGTGRIWLPTGRANLLADFTLQLRDAPEGISLGQLRSGIGGTYLEVSADKEKVAPGLKGNLLVELLQERRARPGSPSRLIPVALLPAIPFEVVPQ
ncbi:MAG: PPC domain-containing protein [Thermoguttaceae bacterium]|nr:PPC domain-containing protein [Thermoguttaceae bacterium]MDW8078384.1 hypothetical protein [Thermoguttaceae bacterium]